MAGSASAARTPADPPEINANYGGETVDTDRIVTMVKIARDIYRTKAMADWGLTELSPDPQVTDDAALRQWVLNNTGSYYHFVGSCKMSTDNTHATTVMIAERAGDFIKATA